MAVLAATVLGSRLVPDALDAIKEVLEATADIFPINTSGAGPSGVTPVTPVQEASVAKPAPVQEPPEPPATVVAGKRKSRA